MVTFISKLSKKIMSSADFCIGILIIILIVSISSSSPSCISCSCGSSNDNYTHCIGDAANNEYTCKRWAYCQTCKSNSTKCETCPPNRFGANCEEVKRTYCPDPGILSGGYRMNIKGSDALYPRTFEDGESVVFSCKEGFGLKGSSFSTCQTNGAWTAPRPRCVRFPAVAVTVTRRKRQTYRQAYRDSSCPRIESPDSGSLNCRMLGNRYRSCTGRCLPGYKFDDEEYEYEITLDCQAGIWTPRRNFPPCKSEGYCNLLVVGTGFFNCTTGMDGTRCDVVCDGRFQGRYRCYPGRDWNPQLPYCVNEKAVESIGRTLCRCENGGTCDNRGKCVCPSGTTGMRCEQLEKKWATCMDPGIPRGGNRLNSDGSDASYPRSFKEGESVVYSCRDEAFALQGTSFITCQPDGTWTAPRPRCIRSPSQSDTFCADPGQINFGFRRLDDGAVDLSNRFFIPGQSVIYLCRPGYQLRGNNVLTCLQTGQWSNRRPTCRRSRRGSPATPSPEPPPNVEEQSCIHPGVNPNSVLTDPPLGPWNSGVFSPGTEIRYECAEGFEPEGPLVLYCLRNGEWSSDAPTCRSVPSTDKTEYSCRHPGVDVNGVIEDHPLLDPRRRGQIFPPGTILNFSCNEGYEAEGLVSIYCLRTGEWSSGPPSCQRIATTTDSMEYSCRHPGVDVNGVIEEHPLLDPRKRGQIFPPGTVLNFNCNEGYEAEGSVSIYCLRSGEWSSAPPTCRRITTTTDVPATGYSCRHPGVDENGIIRYHPLLDPRRRTQLFPPGTELIFDCKEGYVAEGPVILYCLGIGSWTSAPPFCRSITTTTESPPSSDYLRCPNPGVDPNGTVEGTAILDARRRRESFEIGSELSYSCKEDFEIEGAVSITCLATGQWSNPIPKCIPKPRARAPSPSPSDEAQCINHGPISNGRVVVYRTIDQRIQSAINTGQEDFEYPVGTRLLYSCEEGYALSGTPLLVCESSGYWSAEPPRCFEDCGRSALHTTRRITNGSRTLAGEWPWTVAISIGQSDSLQTSMICGGVLLDTSTVMTAAHCLTRSSDYILFFGKFHRDDKDDDDKVSMGISSRIVPHPQYNNVTYENDIALIKFVPNVRYTSRIQPICLPTPRSTSKNLVPGRKGYVTGWGLNENQVVSEELMMAHLPVQSNETCIASLIRNRNPIRIKPGMFCAGFEEGVVSACTGDSGSPFVFFDNRTKRHTVEGIVSFAAVGNCGKPGRYTVFTKVGFFMEWIIANWPR